jgi:uncharacterized protein with ParB-like and HNH nuclease domain
MAIDLWDRDKTDNMKEENLLKELSEGRKEIKTDSYSMSIGELLNLYTEGELQLDPAYQRLFRWSDEQKSNFFESILLGIPIPPIFVAQKEGGKWSVVDGVQRISSILQLTGDLKNKDALTLTTTRKLPSLEGFTWQTLPDDIKRILKRSKFGINIILTENSIQAQYELFQRLNTGGLHLEPQEIRNCLIIMLSEPFYEKINELKNYSNYKSTLPLSEEKFKIEHHMELILRYFIAKNGKTKFEDYKVSYTHLSEFIDKETVKLIEDQSFNIDSEISLFKKVFDLLNETLGADSFKKYNEAKDRFEGPFVESSFEAIVPGIANNFEKSKSIPKDKLVEKIKEMYKDPIYLEHSERGTKAITRMKGLTDFSNQYFSK